MKIIKDLSHGVDQKVTLVEIDETKYIHKEPKRECDKVQREILGCKYAEKAKIPCFKIFKSTKKDILEEYIEGKMLSNTTFNKNNFIELGKQVRKIHNLKMSGFGEIKNNKGINKTGNYGRDKWFYSEVKNTPFDIEERINYYESNKHFLKEKKSVICHYDITKDNVIVNKKNIVMIDFGDLCAGFDFEDLATSYIDFSEKEWSAFVKGYGKHDIEKIKFGAFIRLTWMYKGRERLKKKFQEIYK